MADLAIQTPEDFARALLRGIGAPTTPLNVRTVADWERHEGGNWINSAHYNPLNTTLRMPGSTKMGAGPGANAGVQAFTSWNQGLEATIRTLLESGSGSRYRAIVNDLRGGESEATVAADVRASPWGTKGWYPTGSTANVRAAPKGSGGIDLPNLPNLPKLGPFDLPNLPNLPHIPSPKQAAGDVAGAAGGAVVDGAKAVISWATPGLLIALGLVVIVVGLVVLATKAGGGAVQTVANAAGQGGGGGGGGQGRSESAPAEGGAAEAAAV